MLRIYLAQSIEFFYCDEDDDVASFLNIEELEFEKLGYESSSFACRNWRSTGPQLTPNRISL